MNKYTKIFILLLIVIVIFGSIISSIRINKLKKDLLKAKNDNTELYKYSDSLQVAKAIILEKSEMMEILKQDKDLYDIIKKQRKDIISLIETNTTLTLSNFALTNQIEEAENNLDGTTVRNYTFNQENLMNEDISIKGSTKVIYADSLAKPLSSYTYFDYIKFKNIKLEYTHTYDKNNNRIDVFVKSNYPYLTIDSTFARYNIDFVFPKEKSFGFLAGLGLFEEFNKEKNTFGSLFNVGLYYKKYELILSGSTNPSASIIFQKRF